MELVCLKIEEYCVNNEKLKQNLSALEKVLKAIVFP